MKHAIHFFLSLFISGLLLSCNAQNNDNLSADEFEKAISSTKDSIQILDVRTPGEFQTGHIKNALLADWREKGEFNRRISFIDKEKPVYIYCLSGGRSAAAAKKMRSSGYKKVYELTGGINAWKASGKEVEGRSTEKQLSIADFNTAISGAKIVVVDFGAEWCPPCKKMEPVLKSLQQKYQGKFTLLKVDGGRDEDLMKQYNVTALPVFIIFRDGKEVWRKDGIADEKEFAVFLNN